MFDSTFPGRRITRRTLIRRVPALVLAGGLLHVTTACSPVSFRPDTPEPAPDETPASIPDPRPTPVPASTPAPESTPTPTPAPTPTPEPAERTIRVAGTFFDPVHETSMVLPECVQNAFTTAGLVRLSSSFAPEPDWAESWEPLDDRDGWRFRLRVNEDGWGDGVPLTAHDFVAHWLSVLEPERSSQTAALLFDVENARSYHMGDVGAEDVGVIALNDWTLEITLDRPRETFPVILAALALRPTGPATQPRDGCLQSGRVHEAERTDNVLSFLPSAGYWDAEPFELDRIELTTYAASMALTEFGQELIDLVRLSSTDVARVSNDPSFSNSIVRTQPERVILLVPNVALAPFDSRDVRRALGLLLDRRRLESIVEGRVIPATRMFPSGMFPMFDDAAAGINADFDVDAALEAIAASPYPDPGEWPTFGLDIPSLPSYLDRIARDIASQFRENLGIQVPIRVHDPEEYQVGLRERRYPLAWLDWVYPYADPASCFAELFPAWREPGRPISWSDPEFDELVQAADTLTTNEERASAWAGCEGLILERGACVPLIHPADYFLVQPWVEGLPTDGRGRFVVGQSVGIDIMRRVSVGERRDS